MYIFEYLRFGKGHTPGAPLEAAVNVPCRVGRGGGLPLLGRLCLQMRGGRPFLPSPLRGRIAFLLFLIIGGRRGVGFGVFGHHIRSALMAETTSGPLGLLLRRLIGRRNQHLR